MGRNDWKPLEKDAQTPDQEERCGLVEECSKDGTHSEEDMKSYTQLAYFAGQQWIAVNNTTKQIVPLPKEPWQVQYVANRIMPAVRTELAKIMKNKLTKMVVPASSEDSDIRAARLADKVVEWLEYDLKLQEVDEEALMWTLVTRISFAKPVWNSNKGVTLATQDGKPAIKQGDVDIEILNLFEVKWDPSASKWDDIRWAIHERQRTLEYIKSVYGKDVKADEGLSATNVFDGKLKSLMSGSSMMSASPIKAKDCAMVREYWEMPSHEYPKGRRITVAGGVELYYEEDIGFGEEDTTERQIPIFPLDHIPVPGKIIGSSLTEQLMPVQREYNKSRSQIIENKNLMANPKWLCEAGSIIDDEIDTAPGATIWYRKGFAPPIMSQPASLGMDVDKNISHCLEEFMHISAQMEVSSGTAPTGVSSGVAIQLLQEQDDTKLGPTIAGYARWKQAYLSYLLKLVRFKYTEDRTVQLVGKNKRIEAMEFRGSELTSTDVRFEDQSLTQLTSAARKQYVIELISYAVLDPVRDRDLIIRMLELGINDELYDASEQDVQQALNENGSWAKGDFSPITREFYNHEVHINQHDKFRKGDEYNDLDVEQQAAVDAHVEEHKAYMMQAMMAMVPQQPPAEGEGGNPQNVLNALTPEEQATLQQNPHIIDQVQG